MYLFLVNILSDHYRAKFWTLIRNFANSFSNIFLFSKCIIWIFFKGECPGENEEFLCGGEACQKKCSSRGEACGAHLIDNPNGCYCKKGYIRSDQDNKCIRESECPQ